MSENEFRFTDGAAYERFMGPWTRAVGSVFLGWLAIPASQRWLDVGCGTGIFTELLLDTVAPTAVVAIDPAPAQIEQARAKPISGLPMRRRCLLLTRNSTLRRRRSSSISFPISRAQSVK